MSEFKLQIKITYSYFLVCIVHYEDLSFSQCVQQGNNLSVLRTTQRMRNAF